MEVGVVVESIDETGIVSCVDMSSSHLPSLSVRQTGRRVRQAVESDRQRVRQTGKRVRQTGRQKGQTERHKGQRGRSPTV